MELRDILARRRTHRAFLPDPIPREQVESASRSSRLDSRRRSLDDVVRWERW